MKAQWANVALTAILSLSLVGGIALAQEYTNPPADQTIQQPTGERQFQPLLEKSKDLIGAKVIDRNGNSFGKIEDIVLTPQRDAISYVALSYNGKYFAVPWSAFELSSPEQGKVQVLLTSGVDYLKTANGFDRDHWPMVADRDWPVTGTVARNIPGEQPQATERTAPGMTPMASADINFLRLSKLVGTTVKNSEGTEIGKLNNLMLDWHTGKVAYGLLSVDRSFLGTGGKLAAIPWSAIRIDTQQKVALLNVDRDTLQVIAFDENHFPNFADPQYSRDLYQRFNVRPYWEALGFVPSEQHPSTTVPEESEHSGHMEGMNESMGYYY